MTKHQPRASQGGVKLFVFDFDGTALGGHDPYDQFPPKFVAFLDSLREAGVHWATNTTWAVGKQFELIERSGVKNPPAFLFGSTGRTLANVKNGELLIDVDYSRRMEREDRRFRRRNAETVRNVLRGLFDEDVVARLSFNALNEYEITFEPRQNRLRACVGIIKPLRDSGAYYLFNHRPRHGVNMLMPGHVNKGAAVEEMTRRLDLTAEETLVAGDQTNDLHMFNPKIARHMVCPSNAHDTVKRQVAKHDGFVSELPYSQGIVEGAKALMDNAS